MKDDTEKFLTEFKDLCKKYEISSTLFFAKAISDTGVVGGSQFFPVFVERVDDLLIEHFFKKAKEMIKFEEDFIKKYKKFAKMPKKCQK